jgi:hypothetical protein
MGEKEQNNGGRLSPKGKGKKNLFRFVSPTKTSPTSQANIEDRLKSAEKRRRKQVQDKASPGKKRAERFERKQMEVKSKKSAAKNEDSKKMENAVNRQQQLKLEKAEKAAQHNSYAQTLATNAKTQEQQEPAKKRDATAARLKSAAERREQHLAQRQESAKRSAKKSRDAKSEKGRQLREKKAALDQRMKDSEVRRSVQVARHAQKARKMAQVKTEAEVIEIPITPRSPTNNPPKVVERLASYSGKEPATLEKVQERMRNAEERRHQFQQEKKSPSKAKDRHQRVEINRIQLKSSKRNAAAASNLKRANAEMNKNKLVAQKARKASQQYARAKARNANLKNAENAEVKLAAVTGKQDAAALRREQFLMERKESAERNNMNVQEKRREKEQELRAKKAAQEQKLKDAAVRRNVAVHQKTWHHKQYCPPKTNATTKPSPTKDAFGKWAEVASNASDLEGSFNHWQETTKTPPRAPTTQQDPFSSYDLWKVHDEEEEDGESESSDGDYAEDYDVISPREAALAEVGKSLLLNLWMLDSGGRI